MEKAENKSTYMICDWEKIFPNGILHGNYKLFHAIMENRLETFGPLN